jgi:hypothetical protein
VDPLISQQDRSQTCASGGCGGKAARTPRAGELDQGAVAHELGDPAVVLGDYGFDEVLAHCLQALRVLASSTAMNRLWPTTSAARIATSLRAINSVQPTSQANDRHQRPAKPEPRATP